MHFCHINTLHIRELKINFLKSKWTIFFIYIPQQRILTTYITSSSIPHIPLQRHFNIQTLTVWWSSGSGFLAQIWKIGVFERECESVYVCAYWNYHILCPNPNIESTKVLESELGFRNSEVGNGSQNAYYYERQFVASM